MNRVPLMTPRFFDEDGDEIAGPADVAEDNAKTPEPEVYTQTGVEAYAHLVALTARALKGCGVCGVSWCISCPPQYSRVKVLGKTRWVEATGTGWGFLKVGY